MAASRGWVGQPIEFFSFQFFKKKLLKKFCRKISFKNFLFLCPKLSVKNFICPKCVENLLLKREVAKCSRPALLYWQLVLTEKNIKIPCVSSKHLTTSPNPAILTPWSAKSGRAWWNNWRLTPSNPGGPRRVLSEKSRRIKNRDSKSSYG